MRNEFKAPFFVLIACIVITGIVLAYANKGDEQRLRDLVADLSKSRAQLASENDSLKRALRFHDNRTLWLARAVYSETDKPSEMRLVAWVVRNRVENTYRGHDTYKGVVLDPKQFSAFNEGNPLREYYMTKPVSDAYGDGYMNDLWMRALEIADRVRRRSPVFRPFSKNTLYFYSQVSMPEWKQHPDWRPKFDLVQNRATRPITAHRFRFYKDPQCRLCGVGTNASSSIRTASFGR